jgi:hypothetical protein
LAKAVTVAGVIPLFGVLPLLTTTDNQFVAAGEVVVALTPNCKELPVLPTIIG